MAVQIRSAKEKDASEILFIQDSLILSNNREAEEHGFLVYPISKSELKKLIRDKNNIVLVAEENKKIRGYALAYDLNEWKKIKHEWESAVKLTSANLESKVLYFRHIARLKGSEGVGKKLEEAVYTLAKKRNYEIVIGEILEKPIANKVSLAKHLERGYKKLAK